MKVNAIESRCDLDFVIVFFERTGRDVQVVHDSYRSCRACRPDPDPGAGLAGALYLGAARGAVCFWRHHARASVAVRSCGSAVNAMRDERRTLATEKSRDFANFPDEVLAEFSV